MKLFGTMEINERNHLDIGGCDSVELAKEFGTPLYVVDEELVRNNCRSFKDNFSLEGVNSEVIYASKAFLNLAMCRVIKEEGLSLDVVSGGELFTAIKADFPVEKIYMHGNNKTYNELYFAIESGVGRIIVDNTQELERIVDICEELNKSAEVLLRVNPGIDAHTHAYIQTSKHDSKFGISIFEESMCEIIGRFTSSDKVKLKGFHCHIGSQIFEEESFYSGASVMLDFIASIRKKCGFITEELNLGGGFGVYYSNGDAPVDLSRALRNILLKIKTGVEKLGLEMPKVMIEPGRAIVANAGTTLYQVGGTKETFGGIHYLFVDGGMTDNPRTALYDAKYEAVAANKANKKGETTYTVAGKCCESGDILIRDIVLPKMNTNDILAILSTGAYNYSMSSNYNRIPRPAVVFVRNGTPKLAVKRETYEDLIRNDLFI